MKYQVLTDTAKGDLRDIAFYALEQSKERAVAMRFIEELRERRPQSSFAIALAENFGL